MVLPQGDVCVRTAKVLVLVQDKVAHEDIQNAQQTTLVTGPPGGVPGLVQVTLPKMSRDVTYCHTFVAA